MGFREYMAIELEPSQLDIGPVREIAERTEATSESYR
jgi:hypothetical protein